MQTATIRAVQCDTEGYEIGEGDAKGLADHRDDVRPAESKVDILRAIGADLCNCEDRNVDGVVDRIISTSSSTEA